MQSDKGKPLSAASSFISSPATHSYRSVWRAQKTMNVISDCASVLAEKNPALAEDVKVLSNDFPPLPTPFLIHVAIFLAIDLNNMFRQHWKYFRLILQRQHDLCVWKGHFSGESRSGAPFPRKGENHPVLPHPIREASWRQENKGRPGAERTRATSVPEPQLIRTTWAEYSVTSFPGVPSA